MLITDFYTQGGHAGKGELRINSLGMQFNHNPASAIHVKVAAFTSEQVLLTAYGPQGVVLGTAQSSGTSGAMEMLSIKADGIDDRQA